MNDWDEYVIALRNLCTALDLFNPLTFDWGHPVFDAIFRAHPAMRKEDRVFVENVIGYYTEWIDEKRSAA